MKKIYFFTCTALLLIVVSCAKGDHACQAGDPNIIGATCNDGSGSSATGSGACSSHDGVGTWRCED